MRIILAILVASFITPALASDAEVASRIEKAMLGDHRSEANKARNVYRNPVGTLTFFGLEDGMTVMEISPGGGWYTEILAPAIRGHGQYIAAGWDTDVEGQPDYVYRLSAAMMEKFQANPELYDQAAFVPFSPPQSASLGEAESVDMIVTFRNTHGWIDNDLAEMIFAEFARVLKPGGILGLVQHRSGKPEDPDDLVVRGYVAEETVINIARDAGLYLEARSEVNANPKDSHDHEEGVWTLPPSVDLCEDVEDTPDWDACAAPWLEIGESDRMTLRFRKPMG
ncbi:MAG TPA: methyltransferase [Xanthomonadales bacterium]|nr:methyltransferase [Xanthomonadales bacterium]